MEEDGEVQESQEVDAMDVDLDAISVPVAEPYLQFPQFNRPSHNIHMCPKPFGRYWPPLQIRNAGTSVSSMSRVGPFSRAPPLRNAYKKNLSVGISLNYNEKAAINRVALIYDEAMLLHEKKGHPERPERISSILNALDDSSISSCCSWLPSQEALMDDLLRVHTMRMVKELKETGNAMEVDTMHFFDENGDAYANKVPPPSL